MWFCMKQAPCVKVGAIQKVLSAPFIPMQLGSSPRSPGGTWKSLTPGPLMNMEKKITQMSQFYTFHWLISGNHQGRHTGKEESRKEKPAKTEDGESCSETEWVQSVKEIVDPFTVCIPQLMSISESMKGQGRREKIQSYISFFLFLWGHIWPLSISGKEIIHYNIHIIYLCMHVY